MDISFITIILFGGVLLLMIAGVPLAFSTGVMAFVLIINNFGIDGLALLPTRIYGTLDSYVFVSVPMFVMMGVLLEKSGVASNLFKAMYIFTGKVRGGLALQTIAVAVILAAMSGIIGGEIILLGLLALPEMIKRHYDRRLAIGTICAGGSLGTMIPPSIVLIIYGITTNTSIGDLFLAIVVPGLMLAAFYMVYVIVQGIIHPEKMPLASEEVMDLTRAEKIDLAKGTLPPIAVAGWVLFCIYSGIASISEAAAMGVIGAIASSAFYGKLTKDLILDTSMQTLRVCGILMWIVFGATGLIGVYNLFGGSSYVGSLMQGLSLSPLAMLAMMMFILFVLGMFMDWIGILLLTMPIFVPIVISLGYDPIWFGVVFAMNMQMAYLTPPFGIAALYLKGVAPKDIPLSEIYSAMWPFIFIQAFALSLIILFPSLATWLPSLTMPSS